MKIDDIQLKPCPFCGHEHLMDLDPNDIVYPLSIYWREHPDPEIGRHYVGPKDYNPDTDHQCWNVVCQENHGGCGATMDGDSLEEAVEKWNRRS